jgi:hypothetical protein
MAQIVPQARFCRGFGWPAPVFTGSGAAQSSARADACQGERTTYTFDLGVLQTPFKPKPHQF